MSNSFPELVIRGGRVVTPEAVTECDIAISGEEIIAIGPDLPAGRDEIDAKGKIVLPGGIDPHTHIEQVSASGLMTADDWKSATTAAAFGGTTTVIAFAAQHRGLKLGDVVKDYTARAARGAVIDYGFHLMVANPSAETLEQDLPEAIRAGHRSVKVFMSYDSLALGDDQLLAIMAIAKEHGALVCVHAENNAMLNWKSRQMIAEGRTAPRFQPESHPRLAEIDAVQRMICFSDLLDQPVMIFHVSTREALAAIRAARARGSKVFSETCPQYLVLTAADVDKPGIEAAKWIFSPPARTSDDQDALWQGLVDGALDLVSSDHAPYAYDASGKLKYGETSTFKQIANGLPGIEVRMPLLMEGLINRELADWTRFAELTATTPAKLYGLFPRKGALLVGSDADIAIWDPGRDVSIRYETLHDKTGFTPYEGKSVNGWPETVLLRGKVIVRNGNLSTGPGNGQLLLRNPTMPAALD